MLALKPPSGPAGSQGAGSRTLHFNAAPQAGLVDVKCHEALRCTHAPVPFAHPSLRPLDAVLSPVLPMHP